MAAPRNVTISGGPYGFNGKISHATLGSIYICAGAIRRSVSINTREDAASQAKTLYPLYVSQGAVSVTLLHRSHAARDKINDWIKRFMDLSSTAQLEHNYLDIIVPNRRFSRRAVIQGDLMYGETMGDGMLTTTLSLVGAKDPVQRWSERSRMRNATAGAEVSLYFYPAGIQVGWGVEEVYDAPLPPFRPGDPNRPV